MAMAQQPVSQFSATMIGAQGPSRRHEGAKHYFVKEAKEVADHLVGVHHAGKRGHMQLNYSDTVTRLSKQQANVPLTTIQPTPPASRTNHGKLQETIVLKEKEFSNTMCKKIGQEHGVNDMKRRYNRHLSSTTTIKDVMNGSAALNKQVLFPQKATHLQVLALTNTLKMPNAHQMPPDVPKPKKWLGDGTGWEN